jgi:hypothetical protein
MAPCGQIAMQCPHPMQPNNAVPETTALPSFMTMLKSLQTSTHIPQPLHFSASIVIRPVSLVLEVGIGITELNFSES